MLLIRLIISARGMYYRFTGRSMHRDGLTTPCSGCNDTSPHDSHLAPGALAWLGMD